MAGERAGHPYRGNQYSRYSKLKALKSEGPSSIQQRAVDDARSELKRSSSPKLQYIAAHGEGYFPKGNVSEGQTVHDRPHQCYANSVRGAREDPSLTYVEGVAVANTGYRGSLELTPHAWLVDKSSRVIDRTPTNFKITAYLGVKLKTDELTEEKGVTPLAAKLTKEGSS